ncbi:hypothetical protein M3Y97_01081100 [Aphelenchoides bicaudatus]|nr:hypothetical protein M3Y97_01081100 [Aphelenchoides bicaudatus]
MRYLVLFISLVVYNVAADFQVMQITDFHFDADYDTNGDPNKLCHSKGSSRVIQFQGLVKNAVESAAKMFPAPNLILWTGDNVPHIEKYNMDYLMNAINKTSQQLNASFPNVQILPTYGNHDHAPANGFEENDELYAKTYELWKHWIGAEAQTTFLKGGYYQFKYENTLFLVLNTNLYYMFDKATFKNPDDPADQFKYMADKLEEAKKQKIPVIIVAHIAPGMYERKAKFQWFRDNYNAKFLKIVNDYQDVIKNMIFGHHHTDTFHVVRDSGGTATHVCWMCPAVTPWYSDLGDAANNPAFRLYKFNSAKEWTLQDIETYYVDLAKLNKDQRTNWKLEYSFKKTYGLSDFAPKTIDKLLDQMDKNDTVYLQYLNYNSVLYKPETDTSKIDATMRLGQMCSLRHADYTDYNKCLTSTSFSERVKFSFSAFLLTLFLMFKLN